jgi:hypothetical protein
MIVNRELGGAGVFGQAIKARWSFIGQTLELERKAALIPADVAGPMWLLLCSDRSAWHLDELEDFTDFYRTGQFREDDWACNAIVQYMQERGQAFSRCLSGFHYLGRRHDETDAEFQLGVRGPNLTGP